MTEVSSRPVQSTQQTIHTRLESCLQRYRNSQYLAPLHQPSQAAFAALAKQLQSMPADRLILDSGCGTGVSTARLARRFPESVVIGVDQSAHRLAKAGCRETLLRQDNCIWLRAELSTFWRLAEQAGWRLARHYLLYPNPWPKPGQLQRRWHAHPVFPTLLALGGQLTLRTNWEIYAQEFAFALAYLSDAKIDCSELPGQAETSTPFEEKYQASGHRLFSVSADLNRVKNEA